MRGRKGSLKMRNRRGYMRSRTLSMTSILLLVISRRWRMKLRSISKSKSNFKARSTNSKLTKTMSKLKTDNWREKSTSWTSNSPATRWLADTPVASKSLECRTSATTSQRSRCKSLKPSATTRTCSRTPQRPEQSTPLPPKATLTTSKLPHPTSSYWSSRAKSATSKRCCQHRWAVQGESRLVHSWIALPIFQHLWLS